MQPGYVVVREFHRCGFKVRVIAPQLSPSEHARRTIELMRLIHELAKKPSGSPKTAG
ncbi:MAG: hypothetical protein RL094_407 [Candidatus Parcubacteria bacterium]|jgi:hypothetical protein